MTSFLNLQSTKEMEITGKNAILQIVTKEFKPAISRFDKLSLLKNQNPFDLGTINK